MVALGVTQTVSWASSYYLPAILAVPMARELGVPSSRVFAAFTFALIVMAFAGTIVGRQIDKLGGRIVLSLSHVVIAGGLVMLATASGVWSMAAGWTVLGIGMAMGLYDAAFAALVGFYGKAARAPITGVTLIAGFASTIGWPIHAIIEQSYGWRTACLVWAAVHLLVCLPVSLAAFPRAGRPMDQSDASNPVAEQATDSRERVRVTMWLMALLFAAAWFVTGSMAVHLPRLLEGFGASTTSAIAAAALVGPAQVAARLVDFGLLRHVHPLASARIATLLHPLGAAALAMLGAPAVIAFALLHGAGNGILTIVRGTLPLAFFGAQGYGLRQGLISAPARMSQAFAPFLFGLVLEASLLWAVALSSALMLASFCLLWMLRWPNEPPV